MNKPTHTPGIWSAEPPLDDDRASPYWSVRYEAPHGAFIGAEIARITSMNTGHEEANARLIAAAPDLLSVLVQWIESKDDDEDVAAFRRAKEVVQKATGTP